jgi:hypothetical protein
VNEFAWNPDGTIPEERGLDPSVECHYEQDEHGNWIKRIHAGWMMTERKISYFE